MSNLKHLVLILSTLFCAATLAEQQTAEQAAEEQPIEEQPETRVDESDRVSVTWLEPQKFTDMDPPQRGARKRFRNRTLKQLHQFMDKLAKDLPEGHKLHMNVTDLDLAGIVWPALFMGWNNTGNDIRLMRQVDFPRMEFSYQLQDSSGEIIQQGDEALRDMAFLNRTVIRRNRQLVHEKNMLRRWFKGEFKTMLAKN